MVRTVLATLAGALVLAGCAFVNPERIVPGTPAAEVRQQLGAPTARYPAAAGVGERLQYSTQPAGQSVVNIDLDPQGRVARAEQALNEGLFPRRIQPGRWTREDVLREYGRPAQAIGVHSFDGVIWVWRYLDGPYPRLLYIDIDRAGVVQRYSSGDEYPPDPPDGR